MPHTEASFDGGPDSVQRARAFVAEALRAFGLADRERRVELLTSEVVTNAVRHARTPYRVGVRGHGSTVEVEVEDGSPGAVRPGVAAPEADGGRGLMIVAALAATWGVEGRGRGKAVWFRVELDPAPSRPTAEAASAGS